MFYYGLQLQSPAKFVLLHGSGWQVTLSFDVFCTANPVQDTTFSFVQYRSGQTLCNALELRHLSLAVRRTAEVKAHLMFRASDIFGRRPGSVPDKPKVTPTRLSDWRCMAPKKAAPEPVEEDVKEEPPPEIHQGDFVFPDGSTYSGQYMKKGESISMHGDGVMQSGPETFEGSFDNGMYKMGRYCSCSGAVYTGNYRNNKFHGVGDYRWPDGREYRGTWKDGYMHGYGMYLYFSVGADKRFMGFSMNGKFASGAVEQEEAKRAFLQEYGTQCVQSAAAALREMAEKATADGVPSDFLVPKDEAQAERSATEDQNSKGNSFINEYWNDTAIDFNIF
eukprot:s709_g21.t1